MYKNQSFKILKGTNDNKNQNFEILRGTKNKKSKILHVKYKILKF